MKNINTRNNCMIILAVVVLVATCFGFGSSSLQPAPARALLQGGKVQLWDHHFETNFGTVPGQTARVTVANLATTSAPSLVIFRCMFFDKNGILVGESQRTEVPAGQFRGADFLHGGFGMHGEPGTGRKQVIMKLDIQSVRGTNAPASLVTVEVLDQDGKTAALPPIKWDVSTFEAH